MKCVPLNSIYIITKKKKMGIVVICEKKDQAEKVATHMGWTQGKACFHGEFEGKPLTLVYASGHLLTLKDPGDINPDIGWDNPLILTPIPKIFELKAVKRQNSKSNYDPLIHIKRYLSKATEIIIATDADREGEAIAWNIIDHYSFSAPVRRAWLASGLDKNSIEKAFLNLLPANKTKGLYRASQARNQSDYGAIFLVLCYTYYSEFGLLGKTLGTGSSRVSRVVSVGRVQTSALSLAYDREREIANHIPIKHFAITGCFCDDMQISANYSPEYDYNIHKETPGITWKDVEPEIESSSIKHSPLYTDKPLVDAFIARILSPNAVATISSVEEKDTEETAPKPFSLSQAQAFIGEKLKLPAGHVQEILGDLYLQGWLSYARTDESELPIEYYEEAERNGTLKNLSCLDDLKIASLRAIDIHDGNDQEYKPFIPSAFSKKELNHHGIIPTKQKMTREIFASLSIRNNKNLSPAISREQVQETYLYVAKQYIKAMYPCARYKVTDVIFSVNQVDLFNNPESTFLSRFKVNVDLGWRSPFSELPSDSKKPHKNLIGNHQVAVVDATAKEKITTPPARYTLSSFPSEMKNIYRHVSDLELRKKLKQTKGIGTSATRKTIIDVLLKRGYLSIDGGKIVVTNKGEDLLKHVPKWLKSYETTALWENYLEKIGIETSDTKAISMRDEFVDAQIGMMDKLICSLNEKYKDLAVEKVKQPSIVSPPTTKMKNAVRSICVSKGIKAPKGSLSDFDKALSFIKDNSNARNKESSEKAAPSPKSIAYVEKLLEHVPKDFNTPNNYQTDQTVCSELIESIKKFTPPSQGQINLAKKVFSELRDTKKWNLQKIESSQIECARFLKYAMKKK